MWRRASAAEGLAIGSSLNGIFGLSAQYRGAMFFQLVFVDGAGEIGIGALTFVDDPGGGGFYSGLGADGAVDGVPGGGG